MTDCLKTDVTILGGGISGLTAAFELKKSGSRVCLLEKNACVGGNLRTHSQDGFLIEWGPNSILETNPYLENLFQALGIAASRIYARSAAKNRYIVRDGKLHPLPMSPLAFLRTPLFSPAAKWRLLKEPFVPPAPAAAEETLAEFVQRRLGREFLDYAINPFVAGVYAGAPEALTVKDAFPKLHQLEQQYGSLIKGAFLGARRRRKQAETAKNKARLLSFNQGLQTLVNALEAQLKKCIYTECRIESIRHKDEDFEITFLKSGQASRLITKAILSTIPAHAYGELNFAFDNAALNAALASLIYPPVTMVYFGFRENPVPKSTDGFGFLIPQKEQRQILGTVWSSVIFPERAPRGGLALTSFIGGTRQPENARLSETQLQEMVRKDLQDLMGISRAPDLVYIKYWEKAIPQYRPGHADVMAAIEQFEEDHPGIFIGGNFRGGISVADCIKQACLSSEHIDHYIKHIYKQTLAIV